MAEVELDADMALVELVSLVREAFERGIVMREQYEYGRGHVTRIELAPRDADEAADDRATVGRSW